MTSLMPSPLCRKHNSVAALWESLCGGTFMQTAGISGRVVLIPCPFLPHLAGYLWPVHLPGASAERKSKFPQCLAMAEGTACRGNVSAACLSEAWNWAGNESKSDLPVSIQLCLISKTAVMLAQGRAFADQLSQFTVQERARESFHFNGKVVLQYINKVYSEFWPTVTLQVVSLFLLLVSFPVEGLLMSGAVGQEQKEQAWKTPHPLVGPDPFFGCGSYWVHQILPKQS